MNPASPVAVLVVALAEAAAMQPQPEPALRIRETIEYHDVFARTEAELLQSLRLESDDAPHAHGLTEGIFTVERRLTQRDEGCLVEAISIDLTLRMVLPRWRADGSVPGFLRERWERLSGLIQAHEDRHRDNLMQAAFARRDGIAALPSYARCEQADAALKQVVDGAELKRRFADQFVDQRRLVPLSSRN